MSWKNTVKNEKEKKSFFMIMIEGLEEIYSEENLFKSHTAGRQGECGASTKYS
jgi:hypothetical protein